MRLGNSFHFCTRLREYLLGGNSPRDRDHLVRLGVEGLGDRTVPSAVTAAAPSAVTVEKLADAAEGGADGVFRFTRTGDTTDSLVIDVSFGGAATKGDDYLPDSPFGCVTFPAGAASVDVSVRAFEDGVSDPNETVVATVLPPGFMATGPYGLGAGYQAALTIADGQLPNTADPSDPAAGGALPPSVEPTEPMGDTAPAIPPIPNGSEGPLPGSMDSNDIGNGSGDGGRVMQAEFAGIPVGDPLAGGDIGDRLS